jgi:hypothetical protein
MHEAEHKYWLFHAIFVILKIHIRTDRFLSGLHVVENLSISSKPRSHQLSYHFIPNFSVCSIMSVITYTLNLL